jgi:hypothetical protein
MSGSFQDRVNEKRDSGMGVLEAVAEVKKEDYLQMLTDLETVMSADETTIEDVKRELFAFFHHLKECEERRT